MKAEVKHVHRVWGAILAVLATLVDASRLVGLAWLTYSTKGCWLWHLRHVCLKFADMALLPWPFQ